jgi:glucokinase
MKDIIVGIDIGGTTTKFGLVDQSGTVFYQNSMETQVKEDFREYIQDLENAVRDAVKEVDSSMNIIGIGLGAPNGNYYRGTIEHAANLRWKGIIPIVEIMERDFQVPVIITNDANAAAMGEAIYGHATDMKDFIVITLGTGLGAGIVANGMLIHGHDGFAAELGHVIVNPTGRDCGCGRQGCLETYVSATGIKRTVYKLLADHMDDSELRSHSFDELTTKMISECALRGDVIAREAFEYTGRILGSKLADTIAHTNPEAIFILGGLAQAGDLIFEPTIRQMNKSMMPIYRDKVTVMPSGLPNQTAPILGASSLIVNYLKNKL